MAKKGKIPLGLTFGLIGTGGRILKAWLDMKDRTDLTDSQKRDTLMAIITGYRPSAGTFDMGEVVMTWGPLAVGHGVSTYVGGPKGLNVNAKIRAIPIFKL